MRTCHQICASSLFQRKRYMVGERERRKVCHKEEMVPRGCTVPAGNRLRRNGSSAPAGLGIVRHNSPGLRLGLQTNAPFGA